MGVRHFPPYDLELVPVGIRNTRKNNIYTSLVFELISLRTFIKMLLSKTSALLACGLLGRVSASPLAQLFDRQTDVCPADQIVQVIVEYQEVQYPVFINTFIESNTIINVNGGITLNINNAPTTVNTIITATSTVTVTSTV
jgi:hypothetical protein